jgi:hypothetical protein
MALFFSHIVYYSALKSVACSSFKRISVLSKWENKAEKFNSANVCCGGWTITHHGSATAKMNIS